jgi:hypothetical protein
MKRTCRWLTSVLFCSGLLFSTFLQAEAQEPAALPSQAKPVERVLVPVPKEVFRLLDGFQNANWRAVQRPEITLWKSRGNQVQIATLLGTVIAEGFIAMEAKDSAEVRKVGNRALSLAGALGVKRAALRRSRSIMDNADANKWAPARKEWDGVLSDLQKRMIALKSESLAHLVSVSGWLRGTDALCALVLQDFSPERAELIRQPAMIDYLEKQLHGMKPQAGEDPIVVGLEKGLQDIRGLIGDGGEALTEEKVREIGAICDDLVGLPSRRLE